MDYEKEHIKQPNSPNDNVFLKKFPRPFLVDLKSRSIDPWIFGQTALFGFMIS